MIKPRTKTPELTINLVNDTKWSLSDQKPENFTRLVVYRGKYCPICKKYLQTIQKHIKAFSEKGVNVIAISSDSEKRAKATYEEWKVKDLPIGYNFPITDARTWGLAISKGIKEEPEEFIEPALFLIRPDQTLYTSSIQTMPFARPEIEDLLKSIDFIIKEAYPARGEA
ncbi:redoxin domain-containing protein [Gelidibacter salicanalis]|uniref:Redoxin domain-containing protein n=1 Tax=Gelidibacter salicanalis TaxID=291193 RepID=A0A934L001_9FLAO|nr:redoxin domain-containing protein [Gelidibacter salicanalis]MBJ7882835.1 redoxin domain-containing protein [Gelidibacter salicanalis]